MKTILSAFIKAQKEFTPAIRNAMNPHFRNKYADLSACLDAVLPALHANNLALIQQIHDAENGITVETMVTHESGESINFGKIYVPTSKHDAQGYGSALTYGRRYGVMCLGIAPEDDDGNAAAKTAPTPKPERPARSQEALTIEIAQITTEAGLQGFWKGLTPKERDLVRDIVTARANELKGDNHAGN